MPAMRRRIMAALAAVAAVFALALTTAAPAGAATTGHRRLTAYFYARSKIGCPYVWGGSGPCGFDCSGLVMRAYAHAGVWLPHYSYSIPRYMVRIPLSRAKRGDVLVFSGGGHVALRRWAHSYIDANHPGGSVRIRHWSWAGYHPDAAYRLPW